MSPSPRPWWILPFLAACFIAVLFLPLRLWECRTCGDIARKVKAAPTACPSCRDTGRVSTVTQYWRSRPDALICALIQSPPNPNSFVADVPQALSHLLKRCGTSSTVDFIPVLNTRFALDGEEDVVLVIVNQSGWSIPGTARAEACLFNLRGELLDSIVVSSSTREAVVGIGFAAGPAADSAVVQINGSDGEFVGSFDGFWLKQHGQNGQSVGPGLRGWPKGWRLNGVLRFGISDGKFVRIPPR